MFRTIIFLTLSFFILFFTLQIRKLKGDVEKMKITSSEKDEFKNKLDKVLLMIIVQAWIIFIPLIIIGKF